MADVYGFGGIHLPTSWLAALAQSEPRLWLYGFRPFYGAARALHLLGMAGFVGSVFLVDLKLLGLFPQASIGPARSPLLALMHVSFGITVLTGAGLFLYDPIGTGLHTMFLPKLLLIVIGLLHAHGVRRLRAMRGGRVLTPALAAVSLVIWTAVIGCATWNHVERPVTKAELRRLETRP
jgi:hypothetical protein